MPLELPGTRGTDLPLDRLEKLSLRLLGAGMFVLLTGFGAQVAIPLPPDGVPMTLQTLAVVCAALCLGPAWGTASMAVYVLIGVLGGGVFAQGEAGLSRVLGQTGGYLIGFIACQPVICSIIRRRDGSVRGWGAMIIAVLTGHLVIFVIGVPWLGIVRGFSPGRALAGGFYPFVPGMIVKTAIAVLIGRAAAPWAMKRFW